MFRDGIDRKKILQSWEIISSVTSTLSGFVSRKTTPSPNEVEEMYRMLTIAASLLDEEIHE